MSRIRSHAILLAAILVCVCAFGVVTAQDDTDGEGDKTWSNKTEFGLTSTTGNSETFNLSLGNEFKKNWKKSVLQIDLSAIRNETTNRALDDQNQIVKNKEIGAETYYLGGIYRHRIGERLFWYVNGSWFRNRPGGIDDRYRGGAGIGYLFIKKEKHTLLGELGATYTDESQLPDESSTYSSARLFLEYDFKISETSDLSSDIEYFQDFSKGANWQANWVTSITASITTSVALNVTYTVVYNNLPPTGTIGDPPVPYTFDKTDTFLTASVVLNF